jgi:ribosomal-protein-alanine N-acetyltransferase
MAGPTLVGATGFILPDQHRWPVTLAYGGIRLTPFRRRDITEWSEVRRRNQAWLQPWDATSPTRTPRRGVRPMVAGLRRDARAGRVVPWLIRDGRVLGSPLIGQCTLGSVVLGSARFATVGYWIDERAAGHGVMPLAVAMATDYAMRTMGLHRVEICIRPENAASLRVVEKLGFRYEGMRLRFIHIAGDWRDHKCFALDTSEVGEGLAQRALGGLR